MSRYTNVTRTNNDSDFYSPLTQKRGLKSIQQMHTVVIKNPAIVERIALSTDTYIWSYVDRFHKLAFDYYGDPNLWWVIAWYNKKPTEAHVKLGDTIKIPHPLHKVLGYMRND